MPFGGWQRPAHPHRHSAPLANSAPTEKVECVACLDEFQLTMPPAGPGKFKCGHAMCKTCLRNLFKLATTDPQHMPPKCCGEGSIPLEHTKGLFSKDFKHLFNQKMREYTTKNRIYCVKKSCGKWIMPENVHLDRTVGRRYGVCECGTKVCKKCNMRWHGWEDCKNDPETNKLLDTARQEGWQRCYRCKAMVELTEGCNHMRCRCNAQFCILCGRKWKTCDCPWFNAVLDDFEDPRGFRDRFGPLDDDGPVAAGLRAARRARGYQAEMEARRQQVLDDEALAHRLMMEDLDGPFHGHFEVGNRHRRPMNRHPDDMVDAVTHGLNGIALGHDQAYRVDARRRAHGRGSLYMYDRNRHPFRDYDEYLDVHHARHSRRVREPSWNHPAADHRFAHYHAGPAGNSYTSHTWDSGSMSEIHPMTQRYLMERGGYVIHRAAGAPRRERAMAAPEHALHRRAPTHGAELDYPSEATMAGLGRNRSLGDDRVGSWLDYVAVGRPR